MKLEDMDFHAQGKEIAKSRTKKKFVEKICQVTGHNHHVSAIDKCIKKIYGKDYSWKSLRWLQKISVAKWFMYLGRGIRVDYDVAYNLGSIKKTGGMMLELINMGIQDMLYDGKGADFLKIVPPSIFVDYLSTATVDESNAKSKITKLNRQLPIIANAKEKGDTSITFAQYEAYRKKISEELHDKEEEIDDV